MSLRARGFKELVGVEEALTRLLSEVGPKREVESVRLEDAVGRVLAEDVVAQIDVPPFNKSAVDGYAVRSRDTIGASLTSPIRLKVVGEVDVGELPSVAIGEAEAVEVATGSAIPDGADAVVMYEDAKARGGYVDVFKAVTPLENVALKGEDLKAGERVARRGLLLRPWDIGVLASLNMPQVRVLARIRASVLSTGSELIEVGAAPSPGRVVNSTKSVILAALKELGCDVYDLGVVEDDLTSIRDRVEEGIANSDLLITTGGTSVGKADLVREVIEGLGGKILAHGIAMKPGKPTGLALLRGKPVIMLSGYPVAALIGFEAFARPLIYHMLGSEEPPRPVIKAKLTRKVATNPGVRSYLRVFVSSRGGEAYAEPLRLTGSGVLSSVVKANGLVVVPEGRDGYDEGEDVEVTLIRPLGSGGP